MSRVDNKIKYKEYDHRYYIKHKRPNTKIGQAEKQINQLKQQLDEKQNTIDEINKEFVQAVHDWKVLIEEKDKEIEDLKQVILNWQIRNKTLSAERINAITDYDKLIRNINKFTDKQLAIQELEKVKIELKDKHYLFMDGYLRYLIPYRDICDQINQQIKELKG